MSTPPETLSTLYLLAGCYNFGIILFSKFLASDLGKVDPLFDPSGVFLVVLWGATYASVHNIVADVPLLSLVFGVEKAFYGVRWLQWIQHNGSALPALLREDPLTGMFFAIYGTGDLASAALFFYSAYQHRQNMFGTKRKEKE